MRNVLDKKVSLFRNYRDTKPRNVSLEKFLSSDKYKDQVCEIRNTENKERRNKLKSGLPAITPSGTFSERSEKGLKKHSGLIQFDIDWADNQHIENFFDLKDELANLRHVAYVALSVSGKGFWGLIPIRFPEAHKEHFRAIEQGFTRYGIIIDSNPCNVASLRGYSYDPDPYVNPSAEVYKHLVRDRSNKETLFRFSQLPDSQEFSLNKELKKVRKCVDQIEKHRIDITANYRDWLYIGFALARSFGEAGRPIFHTVSQYHPQYDYSKADKQFTACLENDKGGVGLGTFYSLCADYGIRYSK